MNKPTNVLLGPALRATAKRRASDRGLSISAYIRELIRADDATASNAGGDISSLIGIIGTGTEPSDIARHKHEMVRQAFRDGLDRIKLTRTDAG